VLDKIKSRLNATPKSVSIPLGAIVLVGIVWWALYRADATDDYPQPDVTLICAECGYTEQLTVRQYARRSEAELPGGVALIQGPALICPDCGQRCLERQQRPDR